MSRSSFQKIAQYIHCNDNKGLTQNNKDKPFKFWLIIEKLNASFHNNCFGTQQLSLDESMVKFNSRFTTMQHNPYQTRTQN